ncbi:MAG: hypothetical protein DRO40_02100 [Thermoprotei archaeon]|nr:MAG: hypothetical protein DRO40_02100 [Thermoprotei archaeon]
MPRYWLKKCPVCGREFQAPGPMFKYCSEKCRKEARRWQQKKYRRNRKRRGRDYSLKPKPGDRCKICGYDIIYALEYSHEVEAFLCANCHRLYHPGSYKRATLVSRFAYPVKLSGMIYIPGPDLWPERCYLCRQKFTEDIWELHHIIPRKHGGESLGNRNIVIICANCHRILTRANNIINEFLEEFLKSENNPYRKYIDTVKKLDQESNIVKLNIMLRFYDYLSDNWSKVLEIVRESVY